MKEDRSAQTFFFRSDFVVYIAPEIGYFLLEIHHIMILQNKHLLSLATKYRFSDDLPQAEKDILRKTILGLFAMELAALDIPVLDKTYIRITDYVGAIYIISQENKKHADGFVETVMMAISFADKMVMVDHMTGNQDTDKHIELW